MQTVDIGAQAAQPRRFWAVANALRVPSVGVTPSNARPLARSAFCVCALLAGVLLAVMVIGRSEAVRATAATARAREAAAALARVRAFSLQGQAVISATLGADDSAFAARPSDGGFRLAGGGLDAEVRTGRLSVGAGNESLSMTFTGIGRSGRLGAMGAVTESARRNRVSAS